MRANKRLQDVIRIGYLETSSKNSKIQPELNPINMDNTDYEVHSYESRRREALENQRMKEELVFMKDKMNSFEQTLADVAEHLPTPVHTTYENQPAVISESGLNAGGDFKPFVRRKNYEH